MKKRKMDGPPDGGTGQTAPVPEPSDAAAAAAAAAVAPLAAPATAAPPPEDSDARMADTADATAADAGEEGDAAAGGETNVPAELVASTPTAIALLRALSADLPTASHKQFHALRKEVLRLAAQLQNTHFTGETRDDIQKRLHRRKEKGERLARELRAKTADAKYINSVALRSARIHALNALVEPEGWGDKQGDNLLMPGESNKLLMPSDAESAATASAAAAEPASASLSMSAAAASPSPSTGSISMSPSPSPGLDAAANEAQRVAALAAAAGPQSFVYPTIAPASALAEQVGAVASTAAAAPATKPFVRPGGGGGGMGSVMPPSTAAAVAADGSAASPAVIVPPLPAVVVEDETAAEQQQQKGKQLARQQGKGGKQQQQGGGAPGDRAGKKAAFQQEGVHVNAEVLRASKEATAASAAANVGGGISAPGGPVRSAVPSAPNGFVDGSSLVPGVDVEEFLPEDLHHPRSCYCCKARFFKLHFFYSEFCPSCARLNYAKRNQMADLRGKVVLLTGSRVKIGFRCGLRLLRCGATLIATSRFPHDTARRYAEEKDFDQWKSRLHVFGLDLRDLKAVVRLSEILEQKYDRLDAIVNNAAQTVRRPVQYYRHLLPIECMEPEQMPKKWQEVVKGDLHALAAAQQQQGQLAAGSGEAHHTASAASSSNHGVTVEDVSHLSGDALAAAAASPSPPPAAAATAEPTVTHAMDTTTASQAAVDAAIDAAMASATAAAAAVAAAIPSSASASTTAADALSAFVRHDDLNAALATTGNRAAALSQLRVLSDDRAKAEDDALFPVDRFDVTGQQLDLRTVNSWNLPLDKVDPSELVEVFAINALSPFLLNSRLKNLMLRGGAHPQFGPEVQTTDKYIINVSAMEGKFYRHKSPFHPHTNAAKAALNMMTRTSAQDYARSRIYMNSVDTGWINDENPHATAKRIFEQSNFQTPIDEEDAMARILDPLLAGVNSGINAFGKFFKDYHETEW